jgi:hypothetical protein
MSRELAEFSELIDEQFDLEELEESDFWQSVLNMYI